MRIILLICGAGIIGICSNFMDLPLTKQASIVAGEILLLYSGFLKGNDNG